MGMDDRLNFTDRSLGMIDQQPRLVPFLLPKFCNEKGVATKNLQNSGVIHITLKLKTTN
jgi:hypothetical protein